MRNIPIMFLVVALCGCGQRHSSMAGSPGPQANTTRTSVRFLVAQAALGHVMRKHESQDFGKARFSHYLIISAEEFLPELVRSFDGFAPRVMARADAKGMNDREARPKYWRLSIVSVSDDRAVAEVVWHYAHDGAVHRLDLELKDSKWIVVSDDITLTKR